MSLWLETSGSKIDFQLCSFHMEFMSNGECVGCLKEKGGKLHFEGDASVSAKTFFEVVASRHLTHVAELHAEIARLKAIVHEEDAPCQS